MSQHSYSRSWLHVIWGTLDHEKCMNKEARVKISEYLYEYAKSKEIFMKINYVNADHVHALIDLPTKFSIEETMKLIKGGSSHWINENRIINSKFFWNRGYGVFSVSQSNVQKVAKYITNQDEHHRKRTFNEEFQRFLKVYELPFSADENR